MKKKYDVTITLSGNASSIVIGSMMGQISELFKKQFKTVDIDEAAFYSKVHPPLFSFNKNRSILITLGELSNREPGTKMTPLAKEVERLSRNRKTTCGPNRRIHRLKAAPGSEELIEKFKKISENPKKIGKVLFPNNKKQCRCSICGKKLPIGAFGYNPSFFEIEGWKKYHICKENRGRSKLFCENSPTELKGKSNGRKRQNTI